MRIHVATILSWPPARVWSRALNTRVLQHVCWPLVTFRPLDPPQFPEAWPEGTFRVRLRILGVPSGTQTLVISKPAPQEPGIHAFRDNGFGTHVRRWDHWVRVRPAPNGQTLYSDTIDIEAGVLTPVVALYASVFFRWRQARWRRMIARPSLHHL